MQLEVSKGQLSHDVDVVIALLQRYSIEDENGKELSSLILDGPGLWLTFMTWTLDIFWIDSFTCKYSIA